MLSKVYKMIQNGVSFMQFALTGVLAEGNTAFWC